MDERTAQMLVEWLRLGSQEFDPEQAAAVERHLCAQGDVESLVQQDRELDAFLGPAMRAVPVPADLPSRIHTKLAAKRGAASRRRAFRVFGSAAVLLAAFGAVWGVRWSARPLLAPEAIAAHYDPLIQDPFGQARAFLAERGLAFRPALPIDPSLLTAFEEVTFQGARVPMLVFTNHSQRHTARVYVVRSRDFRWESVAEQAHLSFCDVQIVADRDEPDRVAYVVVYDGHSLEPFLRVGDTD